MTNGPAFEGLHHPPDIAINFAFLLSLTGAFCYPGPAMIKSGANFV